MPLEWEKPRKFVNLKETEPKTILVEEGIYLGCEENLKSKYEGQYNYLFKVGSEEIAIGSHEKGVLPNKLERKQVEPGDLISIQYLGKFDEQGNKANYHNFKIATDPNKSVLKSNSIEDTSDSSGNPQTKMNLDDLE
jgi:hypothetical protein